MLTANDIRQKFLDFFESKEHTVVPSSSLIPTNDPTLMFTAAGMVQFKNVFTGTEVRAYTRATSSQRCVRAGGKHNDLENVGHTARHHTFFEMMGNFSFGDYFKEAAIPYAWEFLTSPEWMNLDKERLHITVYHTDDEAYGIWQKILNDAGFSNERIEAEKRIIRIATSDNFWSAGDTGPCGPCTEIFYDHGDKYWGDLPGTEDEDGDRFIEVWNVVFMQYDRQADGEMKPLPKTGVDTGCGLERLTAIKQGVNMNYDIDLFQTVISKASALSGIEYGANDESDVSFRVIADHLRATSFLLVDGVMPSNEGRGYVMRRIMRRAMRHINLLGINEPFMYKLVASLVEAMGGHYGELTRAQKMIEDVIKNEEERFLKTLKQGLKLLEEEAAGLSKGDTLSGETAFKLKDTYGFPLDLTQDILAKDSIEVDMAEYEKHSNIAKEKSRAGGLGTGQKALAKTWFDILDTQGSTEFLGYADTYAESQIVAIVVDEKLVDSLKEGDTAIIVTNQTPFYGESGGQVGDNGFFDTETGTADVLDTQKIIDGSLIQHFVKITDGTVCVKQTAGMYVDHERQDKIKANHSVTHLMHAVLREVLGDHVFQKGSVVNDERLRFDFSQPKALTAEQILEIEAKVNAMIRANKPVTTRLMDQESAIEAGAMALFGEKYGDEVRVVQMGGEFNDSDLFSVELCGGTHVERTGDIGYFKVSGESAISAGVRRIEAVTGEAAEDLSVGFEHTVKTVGSALKCAPTEVTTRVEALQAEIKKLKADLKNAQKGGGTSGGKSVADMVKDAEDVNGVRFVSAALENMEAPIMRELVDELKNAIGSGVVVLAANNGEKSSIVAGVTADLTKQVRAGDVVNAAAATLGGKGGGRPDMAMAGGQSGDLAAALSAARSTLSA